jgi:hypothetical protein
MIFICFVEGGGGGGGVLRVLIGGSELEWEMQRTGWGGIDRVHYAPEFTLVLIKEDILFVLLVVFVTLTSSKP